MRAQDLAPWLSLLAAVLGAGIWLGVLSNRVTQLEREGQYLHGTIQVPASVK